MSVLKNLICAKCAARFEVNKVVEMLVAADRDSNWKLHVLVVEELMPVFLEFDSINYLRNSSWYLQWIKALESENPSVHETFMQGNFVVKDKQGKFNSASPNMKLEQKIQRGSKGPDGIMEDQRKKIYVAERNLIFLKLV